MPVAQMLTSDLKGLVTDYLSPDRIRRAGLFNPASVQKLLDDHLSRKRDNRKQLWTLLVFELWSERYLGTTS